MTQDLPHQGPEWHPFELKGYYEEFHDIEFNKWLGVQLLSECPADRLLGSQGRIEYTLTHNLTLRKGHKIYLLKASKQRPIKVATMVQILGGRPKPLPDETVIHTNLGDFPRKDNK